MTILILNFQSPNEWEESGILRFVRLLDKKYKWPVVWNLWDYFVFVIICKSLLKIEYFSREPAARGGWTGYAQPSKKYENAKKSRREGYERFGGRAWVASILKSAYWCILSLLVKYFALRTTICERIFFTKNKRNFCSFLYLRMCLIF